MYTQFSLFSLFFLWTACRSAEPGGVSGAPSPATAMTADTAAAGSSGSAPSGGTGALGSSGSGDSGDTATAQPVVMEVLHLDGRPVAAGEVVEAALDYGPTAERYLRTRLRFTGPPGLAVSIFAEARGEHGAYYSTFSSVTWSEEGTVAEEELWLWVSEGRGPHDLLCARRESSATLRVEATVLDGTMAPLSADAELWVVGAEWLNDYCDDGS